LKEKSNLENSTEQIEKKEKLVTKMITMIAIVIGILTAFLLIGLLDFF